jgi:hypothetical protein
LTQAAGAPQSPPLEQVATPLPLHAVCPGAQEPTQAPFAQIELTHGTGWCQVPVAPHVCTPLLPPQIVAPATQVPMHCAELLSSTQLALPQETGLPQFPLVSQV